MTGKKKLFHEAATLVLVARNTSASIHRNLQKRPELKTLMIQRSSNSSFMVSSVTITDS